MLANVDREVVGAGDVQILECKTAGIHGARLWRDGVPEYVQLQVMHQLAVTGHRAADVAVLIGGQELRIFRIERDEALIARLIALEQEFWEMVQSGTAPPGDGSESSEKALRYLYPVDSGDQVDLTSVGHGFNEMCHEKSFKNKCVLFNKRCKKTPPNRERSQVDKAALATPAKAVAQQHAIELRARFGADFAAQGTGAHCGQDRAGNACECNTWQGNAAALQHLQGFERGFEGAGSAHSDADGTKDFEARGPRDHVAALAVGAEGGEVHQ